MVREKKMNNTVVNLYIDNSDKSKKIEELFTKYSVPYSKHEEPAPKYDRKANRPYVTIGDSEGTPLGPTSNFEGIMSLVKRLWVQSDKR